MHKCPSGKIHRKSYTKKNGVHVKGACIKDVGRAGKGLPGGEPGIGKMKEGELSGVGYSLTKKATSRHRALNKATKKYGALSVYRKLNALSVYTKRTSPIKSKTAKADRNYLGRKHGYKSS
jgi:hypothetical protein